MHGAKLILTKKMPTRKITNGGHENISTTDKYYNKVDLIRRKKELAKFQRITGAD
jgi:hypothetical protein